MTRTSLFVIVALVLALAVPAVAVPTATSSVTATHIVFQPVAHNVQIVEPLNGIFAGALPPPRPFPSPYPCSPNCGLQMMAGALPLPPPNPTGGTGTCNFINWLVGNCWPYNP